MHEFSLQVITKYSFNSPNFIVFPIKMCGKIIYMRACVCCVTKPCNNGGCEIKLRKCINLKMLFLFCSFNFVNIDFSCLHIPRVSCLHIYLQYGCVLYLSLCITRWFQYHINKKHRRLFV